MILFGENFPVYFSPDFPPVPPKELTPPTRNTVKTSSTLLETITVEGVKPFELALKLQQYEGEDYNIEQSSYDSISVYKLHRYEIQLTDKEFIKKEKEYERKLIRLQREKLEYQSRKEKYPILLKKYKTLKLMNELEILKDSVERNEVDFSRLEIEIKMDKLKIQEITQKLKGEQL